MGGSGVNSGDENPYRGLATDTRGPGHPQAVPRTATGPEPTEHRSPHEPPAEPVTPPNRPYDTSHPVRLRLGPPRWWAGQDG